MLQHRVALRGIRLPFRCVPSLLPRSYSTGIEQHTESISFESSSPSIDPSLSFAPPPVRQDSTINIRKYTPRTPGVRHLRRPINDHLWKGRPVHKLTFPKRGHSKGGRNNSGRVTVRHHGGGHKRRIRMVDFKRDAPGPHIVERIEHDPGRSAHIALLRSKETGKLSYILAADGMRAGDVVQSYMAGIPDDLWQSMGGTVDPGVMAARTAWRGNCLPLHMVPVGSLIFNVGLRPGGGGQLCRSAGTFATVISKGVNQVAAADQESKESQAAGEEKKPMTQREKQARERTLQHITIRLSSGEVRLIHKDCCATIGVASNPNKKYAQLGKAGRSRWLNIRPTVRGLAMNAQDHPHGGGRGKSKGNVDPKSPWGLPAKSGYKTRPKWKINKAVVVPRVRNQGKRRRGYH
ncbi:translation protein SH3-like domain-containing protein [Aspergillus tetrazonus]